VNYALVLSPAAGEGGYLPYNNSGAAFSGGSSTNDGVLIKNNMIAAGIEEFYSQKFCIALTIGGFTDWYLPSQDELEMIYRNFKPTTGANDTTTGANTSAVPPTSNYTTGSPARTTIAAFQSGGAQALGSMEYFSAIVVASNNVMRDMVTGAATSSGFTGWKPIRAVRRVLLAA
jgi:hypothetical protein